MNHSLTEQSQRFSYKPLLWLLAIPLLNVLYALQNGPGDKVHSLVTSVDINTPFIPAFAIPYVIWYPFLFLTLVLILRKSEKQYYQTLLALCMGLILCNLVYAFFQTTVPRPEVPSTGFLNHLVSFVYANDEPFNCFPSIHVLTSSLMIAGSSVLGWKIRIPVVVIALSIIASTLFIKQHVIADVMAGMLVAKFMFWCSGQLLPIIRHRLTSRNQRGLPYADHK
ncbi:phosphatase PAP2 family protein [Cohnella silvisoli]|uniref:Phosphatase PAP2 family protein n=1 Tax=Cohnella silvisoli TaxID=2873699 RepID=A0ABV1KXP2_9BACL|nr:phosphatase PAP2 family protein [Cohnella silvisoli]MCD9023975.1 phosphatase PAP2 family protein [Cohnella silvisoli]